MLRRANHNLLGMPRFTVWTDAHQAFAVQQTWGFVPGVNKEGAC